MPQIDTIHLSRSLILLGRKPCRKYPFFLLPFLLPVVGHSCGIRKTDVRNIFLSLSNRTDAIYDCVLRKCVQTRMYAQLGGSVMEERDDIVYVK